MKVLFIFTAIAIFHRLLCSGMRDLFIFLLQFIQTIFNFQSLLQRKFFLLFLIQLLHFVFLFTRLTIANFLWLLFRFFILILMNRWLKKIPFGNINKILSKNVRINFSLLYVSFVLYIKLVSYIRELFLILLLLFDKLFPFILLRNLAYFWLSYDFLIYLLSSFFLLTSLLLILIFF